MITDDGWAKHSIWEHSMTVKELYTRRCRREEEEMTCHAQAAELLKPHAAPGDLLLDVGCGSGYFFHSLVKRSIPVTYLGIDAARSLIAIGREHLPRFGLPASSLKVMRIEDMAGDADHVVCMNVLSNIDNYHRPLERMLQCARKTVILRESCKDDAEYAYVEDRYLDEGVRLRVHVNTYRTREVLDFIRSYGFSVEEIEDSYTGGKPQDVIGYAHYWKFFFARREAEEASGRS